LLNIFQSFFSLILNYRNLNSDITDKKFRELFEPFGTILSSKIMVEDKSGEFLGFGFIRFSKREEAEEALKHMHKYRIGSKVLLVKHSHMPKLEGEVIVNRNLYIKPLLPNTTEEILRKTFEKFGPIENVKVMFDRQTNTNRHVGFVRFVKQSDADAAIAKMNGVSQDPAYPPLAVRYADSGSDNNHERINITKRSTKLTKKVPPNIPSNQHVPILSVNNIPYPPPNPISYNPYSSDQAKNIHSHIFPPPLTVPSIIPPYSSLSTNSSTFLHPAHPQSTFPPHPLFYHPFQNSQPQTFSSIHAPAITPLPRVSAVPSVPMVLSNDSTHTSENLLFVARPDGSYVPHKIMPAPLAQVVPLSVTHNVCNLFMKFIIFFFL
jgi:RNA recognition motif-containing protein